MNQAVMHLKDYDTDTRFPATVVSSQRITPRESDEEVREIVLDVDRPDFDYKVGQSIGVLAPAPPDFGNEFHFRLYSVADLPTKSKKGHPQIKICVRRCSYVDEYNGEVYKGVASNYLCDLQKGDTLTIAGPFGLPFQVPEEKHANLILIGSGTGIAPFRALVKHLYTNVKDWKGRVWLFYGARTGLEMLYMNDEKDDFAQYYDEKTFRAFKALSPRPTWSDPIGWGDVISERDDELWEMLAAPDTYVYLAGLEKMRDQLDVVLGDLAGSKEKWQRRKAELMAGQRWVELLY